MNRTLDVGTSLAASVMRGGAGMFVTPATRRPEQLLELYEFEGCPFCRKVREFLTAIDLDAKIYPCPRGSQHREVVRARAGKEQFPFLIDPNTGASMLESDAIIAYLATTYGDGQIPVSLKLGPLTTITAGLSSMWRPHRGRVARASRLPEKPLELWSFEASPFSRIARERLCELQLPYVLHNVGKRSQQRRAFVARSGKMQVPYLVDPNTGEEMFESANIAAYLERTYAVAPA